jgi:hypothetical protein
MKVKGEKLDCGNGKGKGGEKRVIKECMWSKYAMFIYENVIMKPIICIIDIG